MTTRNVRWSDIDTGVAYKNCHACSVHHTGIHEPWRILREKKRSKSRPIVFRNSYCSCLVVSGTFVTTHGPYVTASH